MRFGVFISPIHSPDEDPTLSLERDLQLVEDLDRLGFDEVWMGEHHSTGWEIVGSPETFLAAASQRTRRIMLGSGVISLPYHNPYHALERMILVDHLSRGRVIMGVGPGALPVDSVSFGVDPMLARDYLLEGVEVIQQLLRGESVTRKSEWFTLDDARLQLFPYQGRELELAVTASVSASGPRTAGRLGASMLSLAATQGPGTDVLGKHWEIVSEEASAGGRTANRADWRLLGPMFVAQTRKEARAAVAGGVDRWVRYMSKVNTAPFSVVADTDSTEYKIDHMIESGFAVIGTPQDAIDQIRRLEEISGGFGTYLTWANEWASPADTLRSYELMAREVMPVFRGQLDGLRGAEERAMRTRDSDVVLSGDAKAKATADYERTRGAKGKAL